MRIDENTKEVGGVGQSCQCVCVDCIWCVCVMEDVQHHAANGILVFDPLAPASAAVVYIPCPVLSHFILLTSARLYSLTLSPQLPSHT